MAEHAVACGVLRIIAIYVVVSWCIGIPALLYFWYWMRHYTDTWKRERARAAREGKAPIPRAIVIEQTRVTGYPGCRNR